jgi:multicomponent Na+:H+ antiporter subunit F
MIQDIALYFILPILSMAIAIIFIRLVKGPTLADRVVSLDLMTTVGIAVIAIYAIAVDQPLYLDVAAIVALISFLGTIAFAYYLEKRV